MRLGKVSSLLDLDCSVLSFNKSFSITGSAAEAMVAGELHKLMLCS